MSFLASLIAVVTFIFVCIPKSSNNLAGEWLMISRITNADMKSYIGAEVQWKMFITECDNKIKGTAEKIKINDIDLEYNQRTSLEFDGVIEKEKLFINYIENGKSRKTSGIMEVVFQNDKFSGKFSQTASSAIGTVEGTKLN